MEYNYKREIVNNLYNVDNNLRVSPTDPDRFVTIKDDIKGAFPSHQIGKVCLMGEDVIINIEPELDGTEKTLLDQVIVNYKAGIDT